MTKILFISGARPNLIKLAPLYKRFKKDKKFKIKLLHTNQHSNKFLFGDVCRDLELPKPNYLINKINVKNNINMISYFMNQISNVIDNYKPNLIILFGDVDTTLASSITSSKKNFISIHVEAGLRSKDYKSQEEINRRIVDHLSDINFCTTKKSLKNLENEGLKNRSYLVGNIIFDNYFHLKDKINKSNLIKKLSLLKNNFILITIHRYQTINSKNNLKKICNLLNNYSKKFPVVFSCHTRTKKNLKKFKLFNNISKNIKIISPLKYTDFTNLLINSKLVVTDSGGVHEEAFFHKKKCLVLRDEIEREEFIDSKNIMKINFNNYLLKLNKILKTKEKIILK